LRVLGIVGIRHGDGVYLQRSPADLVPTLASEVANAEVDHSMISEVREGVEVRAASRAERHGAIDRTSEASLTLPGRAPVSLQAHRRILDAIHVRDEEAAADAMRRHITVSAESVTARTSQR
jgi:DNA-binding FadR family transcriptional regulator